MTPLINDRSIDNKNPPIVFTNKDSSIIFVDKLGNGNSIKDYHKRYTTKPK